MDAQIAAHIRGIEDQLQKPARATRTNQKVTKMLSGKIKFFNKHRNYGFVARDDGQGDVYLHARALERGGIESVEDGDKVEFDIGSYKGKSEVADIKLAA